MVVGLIMKKCTICGNRNDIYDLTLRCCFDCRHKIDERKEMEEINKTIKDFEERKNMEYKISNLDFTMKSEDDFYDTVDMGDFRDADADLIYEHLHNKMRIILNSYHRFV